ncbi:hypothetical protein V490_01678 [Pseudogymnoascus sp. VKM F-3557]|nr:hypothetical protein V490_01678 [Pseudogymnoascus sp. VKM F-3557]
MMALYHRQRYSSWLIAAVALNSANIQYFTPTNKERPGNEKGRYPFDERSKIAKAEPTRSKKRNLRGGDEESPEYQEVNQEVEELTMKYLDHLRIRDGEAECPDDTEDNEVAAALVYNGRETIGRNRRREVGGDEIATTRCNSAKTAPVLV